LNLKNDKIGDTLSLDSILTQTPENKTSLHHSKNRGVEGYFLFETGKIASAILAFQISG
jgi:hypothetical protein